jgi:hypothetical protein
MVRFLWFSNNNLGMSFFFFLKLSSTENPSDLRVRVGFFYAHRSVRGYLPIYLPLILFQLFFFGCGRFK